MDPVFLILIVLIFAGIAALAYALYTATSPPSAASQRLAQMGTSRQLQRENLIGFVDESIEGSIYERVSKLAQPADESELEELKRQLLMAGYKNPRAAEMFNGMRVMAAIMAPAIMIPITVLLAGGIPLAGLACILLASSAAGYYIPKTMMVNNVAKRQEMLMLSFPDALDLLVSSVESGLGIDAALQRVAREIAPASPSLANELQLVNHEIDGGVPRLEALRRLGARTGVSEIQSLVNMLTQAERFGTSIARSLRVHSKVTRQRRMSRAEEEAAKVGPKITIVMILFMLPCLMVVLLGPAGIRIINNFND
jgi:tight adherence protein C